MNGEDLMTLYRDIVHRQAEVLADPVASVGVLSLVRSCPVCSSRVIEAAGAPESARCTSCGWRAS